MKMFVKKNIIILFLLVILLGLTVPSVLKYLDEEENNTKWYQNMYQKLCVDEEESGKYAEKCVELKRGPVKKGAFSTFAYLLFAYDLDIFIMMLSYFYIALPFSFSFYKKVKNGYIKNILQRKKYNRFIIEDVISNYKYILIWICIVLVLFAICFIINPSFAIPYQLDVGTVDFPASFYNNLLLNIPLYFINLVMVGMIIVNVNTIFLIKIKNYLFAVIASFISYLSLEVITKFIVSILKLKSDIGMFNCFIYLSIAHLWHSSLLYFVILLLSSLLLYVVMNNKEKVINDCEK